MKSRKAKSRNPPRPPGAKERIAPTSLPGRVPSWLGHVKYLKYFDWPLFILAAISALALDLVLQSSSGAFWRDEVGTILVSREPTWSAMWWSLGADSFPGLLATLLRLLQATPLGATDTGIRWFGTLILMGLIPAVVWTCRSFSPRAPLLALALLVFNPTVFYYAGSIRGYGVGALTDVLALGAIWRLATKPSYTSILVALGATLLCAQSNYHNSYVIFSAGSGAAAACALARLWKRALLILSVCFLAALSLLPYLPVVSQYWDLICITQFDLDSSVLPDKFLSSLGGDSTLLPFAWIGAVVFAFGYSIYACFVRYRRGGAGDGPSLHVFTVTTMLLLVACGYYFLRSSKMFPNVWYFLPPIAALAVLADVSLQGRENFVAWTGGRMAIFLLLLGLSVMPVWEDAHIRRSNIDLVARTVDEKAVPGDLVLIEPFWLTPGYRYYHHGDVEWNCVPLVSQADRLKSVQHAAIKDLMAKPGSLQPTLDAIGRTLASGHRVWMVGGVHLLPPNTLPPPIPPAPSSQYGWDNNAYTSLWALNVGYYIQKRALRAKAEEIPVDQPVSSFENVLLVRVEGWRGW